MGADTKIEWADHTWSPWVGCTKVSPACDNCYAESWAKRAGSPELWQGQRRRTSADYWQRPRKWNRQAEKEGTRFRVFPSLCDPFDNQAANRTRDDMWHLIEQTPQLIWLLLTKRPQNIARMLPGSNTGTKPWGAGWPNVWFGTTVENQTEMLRRGSALRAVPAVRHFWSAEPLLGDLGTISPEIMPNWIIAGGDERPEGAAITPRLVPPPARPVPGRRRAVLLQTARHLDRGRSI